MSLNDTTLPELSAPYALTPEQIDNYQRDGHIHLTGVATADEVAAYRPLIGGFVNREQRQQGPLGDRDTYHKAFLQVANLWEDDERIARFTLARRFARIAAELMQVRAVRLYHDQALFKEPGGGPTPWHQDQYYWPLDTDKTITMWMALVDIPVEMGVLTFASGAHRHGSLCGHAISEDSDAVFEQLADKNNWSIARQPLRAGDATFHGGWTPHQAPGNNTGTLREVMTVIYYADGALLVAPCNPHQPADLARWFPDLHPGDRAASRLNPLLYDAKKVSG